MAATAAVHVESERPIATYLARQKSVLAELGHTCAFRRFMLKHDSRCASGGAQEEASVVAAGRGAVVQQQQQQQRGAHTARRRPQQQQHLRQHGRQLQPAARRGACVRPLLVTGCGGSGTHFVHSFVAAMGVLGRATHEEPSPSAQVLVTWAARNGDALLGAHVGEYARWGIANRRSLRPPMVQWAALQGSAPCAYRVVAHVVRHPLKVLASSIAFGQCVECWVHIEEFTLPPLSPLSAAYSAPSHALTAALGNLSSSAREAFAAGARAPDLSSHVRGSILENRIVKRSAAMGGRGWPGQSIEALLQGFMLYWVSWNTMIEPVADFRFQIERADYVALCIRAGVARDLCVVAAEKARRAQAKFEAGNHGGSTMSVTWSQLNKTDAELSAEVWTLTHRYGYGHEPPIRTRR